MENPRVMRNKPKLELIPSKEKLVRFEVLNSRPLLNAFAAATILNGIFPSCVATKTSKIITKYKYHLFLPLNPF